MNQRKMHIRNSQPKMLYHHICTTTFGHAAVLFQTAPLLVMRVFLPHPDKTTLEKLIQKTGPGKSGRTPEVLKICRAIQTYFKGNQVEAPWKLLDLSGLTDLQRAVLKAVARVPHGEVRSYSEIAERIGRPRACRFVGTTLARNPFPILIPCHRIVRSDGSPGRFSGGTDLKGRMLLLEKGNGSEIPEFAALKAP